MNLQSILLREYNDVKDGETGLTVDTEYKFRLLSRVEDGVLVEYFDTEGVKSEETVTLNIPEIPMVIFDIVHSLLFDVWRYQVALLNIASSDVSYTLRSNFPFYVEQYSPQAEDLKKKMNSESGDKEVEAGAATGRRYPAGMDAPQFIHPSAEPLTVSMQKQDQLKSEIRELMHLALSTMSEKMASKESKEMDMQGLESGLSYIGLVLEKGEQQIANFWAMYEGNDPAIIKYPTRYSLKTDEERLAEALELEKMKNKAPSSLFKREIAKQIINLTIGPKVSDAELQAMYDEVDNAAIVDTDPKVLALDVERGILDVDTASTARGYPAGTAEKAKKDAADRQAMIMAAQTNMAARGVPDLGGNADTEKVGKNTRGEGK